MSAASLNVLRGQIARGVATLTTIDTWEAKHTVTATEADTARAYWHELYDPPPAPDPTPTDPTPAAAEPTPASAGADAGAVAGADGSPPAGD